MTWKVAVVFGLLFIAFGFFIGKSCSSDATLTEIDRRISESERNREQIAKNLEALADSVKQWLQNKQEINNYYKYETTKIDSIYQLPDSTWVNAVIRAWTDKVYSIPAFFQIETPDSGTTTGW